LKECNSKYSDSYKSKSPYVKKHKMNPAKSCMVDSSPSFGPKRDTDKEEHHLKHPLKQLKKNNYNT